MKRVTPVTGQRMVGRDHVPQAGERVGRILLQCCWNIMRSSLVPGTEGVKSVGGERLCRRERTPPSLDSRAAHTQEQEGFWLGYCHSHKGYRRNDATAAF